MAWPTVMPMQMTGSFDLSEPSPAGDPLLVESHGDRVVATLHRPHKRNAIDQETIDALLGWLLADERVGGPGTVG